jgi:hypothetical protein
MKMTWSSASKGSMYLNDLSAETRPFFSGAFSAIVCERKSSRLATYVELELQYRMLPFCKRWDVAATDTQITTMPKDKIGKRTGGVRHAPLGQQILEGDLPKQRRR